jgi:hypothetical protein
MNMNIKYLLLITLTLPAASLFAADGARAANSGGFSWSGCGEEALVGAAQTAAGALVTVVVGTLLKEWLTPTDKNDSLLKRDKAIENTRQHVQDLRRVAATTTNKELAAQCLKSAEFGEELLAQGIAFRNESFAQLCGNLKKAPDAGNPAPAA